jgi:hypothetical protein
MPEPVSIPPSFKLVFLVVTGLTLLSFLGIALLAIFGGETSSEAEPSVFQRNFSSACNFGWQAGLGARVRRSRHGSGLARVVL